MNCEKPPDTFSLFKPDFPDSLPFHGLLRRLAPGELQELLILEFCLVHAGIRDARTVQELMGRWLAAGTLPGADLRIRIRERIPAFGAFPRVFGKAQDHAVKSIQQGIGALTWNTIPPGGAVAPACPRILFVSGELPSPMEWTAVFNSRKERLAAPDSDWLTVLRHALPVISGPGRGLASSTGTLTYDLVTAYAERHGIPHFHVLPSAGKHVPVHERPSFRDRTSVACTSEAKPCPGTVAMGCRDRLLALLSDAHLVLEIRRGGNLLKVLREQQAAHPRLQRILVSGTRAPRNQGNYQLIESFPQWSIPFSPPVPEPGGKTVRTVSVKARTGRMSRGIDWNRYLYHYTRARPGPWPGQSREEYLHSLLDNLKGSAHGAQDTLARILCEGRIRGSGEMIRGAFPVVSWTSRPPGELASIRKWNAALIRWTFEPYGIAVRRNIAMREGAKPTVYAGDDVYRRLAASERFRYQRHEPPRCSWKLEREWRSRGDFPLVGLSGNDAFVFVPRIEDMEALEGDFPCVLPVAVLDEALQP